MSTISDRIELPNGVTVDFPREEMRGQDGTRVKLRPRSFGVLRCLAAQAGKLVTKDELLAECWPGMTVTEDSLTKCISDIRRALGNGGRELIRTVPGRGYVLVPPKAAPARPSPVPGAPPPSYWPSVAVLPFDESGTGEPGGFGPLGAALAEDITTELARNRGLPIAARKEVFAAKAQGKRPTEIAALFGARCVLEGSIRRLGERMIINAQLLDGRNGHHVWANRHSVAIAELCRVQDDLIVRIASALLGEIRVAGYAASLREPSESLSFQELVWKLFARIRQCSRDGFLAAHAESERAVALGPSYALGHIMRGHALAIDAGEAMTGTVGPEIFPKVIDMIRRGIEVDPFLSFGYQALCLAHYFSGQFDEALLAAERCVAFGPGDTNNLCFLALARNSLRQYAAAFSEIEHAMALNPLFPMYFHGVAAVALYALDRFEEASRNCTAGKERCPDYPYNYVVGAAADIALGRKEAAGARIRVLLRHAPWVTARVPIIAVTYTRDPPLRARFVRHLREAGVPGAEE